MTDSDTSTADRGGALEPGIVPLRRDAERNRQRILRAAEQIFAVRGLGASLDEVARSAGVGVGTVYRRFPDKEALVEAIFEARVGTIIEIGERALALPSGWEGLVHFLREASLVQAEDRGLREITLSTGYGRSRVAALRARVNGQIDQLIARAKDEGILRQEITSADVPLVLFLVGEVAHNSTGFRPDLARRYLNLLIDGLRDRPQSNDLGLPLDDTELQRFMQGWGPAPR